jgi:hypothetical protein
MYINGKRENIDQAKYNASCLPFQDMNSIIVNMLMHLTRLKFENINIALSE